MGLFYILGYINSSTITFFGHATRGDMNFTLHYIYYSSGHFPRSHISFTFRDTIIITIDEVCECIGYSFRVLHTITVINEVPHIKNMLHYYHRLFIIFRVD